MTQGNCHSENEEGVESGKVFAISSNLTRGIPIMMQSISENLSIFLLIEIQEQLFMTHYVL